MTRQAIAVLLVGLAGCTEKPTESTPPSPSVSVQSAPVSAAPSNPAEHGTATPAASAVPVERTVEWVEASPTADFASTVRLERAKAQRAGRTLVVYVGADWCPPCKAFHQAVSNHQLDTTLAKTTFLVFDFDKDAARMGSFGYQTTHIPYFVRPGPDGAPDGSFNVKTLNGPAAVKEATDKLVAWQNATK